MDDNLTNEFERIAAEQEAPSFFSEFVDFVRENRKWWLLPVITLLLLISLLLLLSGTAVAPFIYTMF